MFDDDFSAMEAGAAYALYRHGQDQQVRAMADIIRSLPAQRGDVHIHLDPDDEPRTAVNNLDFVDESEMLDDFDDYIGQEPLKRQMIIYMASAQARDQRLPHTLFASGYPGVGKTTIARLIAKSMGRKIIELVPPFNVYALVDAAKKLDHHDVLFIDEIHKLADNGKRGAEFLLKILEDGTAYLPDGTVEHLPDVTIIGATTDRDKLPEPVVDRFKIKPYFQAYTPEELARIAVTFAFRHDCEDLVDDDLIMAIAFACRDTPRITEEMVLAAQAIGDAFKRPARPGELLEFLEVEPDGMTRTHIHYVTAMYQFFPRENKDGEVEYIIGQSTIQQLLRETEQGIGRVERFLIERGLIDRTPRGRRLTPLGIERAQQWVAAGKGASVA